MAANGKQTSCRSQLISASDPKLTSMCVIVLTLQRSIDLYKKFSYLSVKCLAVLQVHEMASALSSPNYG
jgi:hypothetical protein